MEIDSRSRGGRPGGAIKGLGLYPALVGAALVIAAVSSACAQGKSASTLDRRTALAILNGAPQLFNGQEKKQMVATQVVSNPARGGNKSEADKQVPFLDLLTELGILAKTKDYGVVFQPSGLTYYIYSVRSQEGVSAAFPDTTSNNLAVITIGKPVVKAIVGIRQEGSQAIVEVSVSAIPTPLYEKVMEAGKALFAQCETFPDPKPAYCTEWPSRGSFEKLETRTFRLARYDDGWRIASQ
jgi:hypothetical protein